MKRWRIWFLIAIIACIPILLNHPINPNILQDTDTSTLLRTIRDRHDPLSWFAGDWPLQNHFYRPIPTLLFELDSALGGNSPVLYGWTNAVLVALCVLALFWLVREMTDSPPFTISATLLMVLWTLDVPGMLPTAILWAAMLIPLVGFLRHGLKLRYWLSAPFVLLLLSNQVSGMQPLSYGTIGWLPGRTATCMALFVLVSMAAYSRYERLTAVRELPQATSTDKPTATKSTESDVGRTHGGLWLGISLFASALALASYEQAVMLPALLLALFVYFRLRGFRAHWAPHAWFWGLLSGYLGLRYALIPTGASQYQNQQFRKGPGVGLDLSIYFLPGWQGLRTSLESLALGPLVLLSTQTLGGFLNGAAAVVSFFQARRQWLLVLTGYLLSGLAFLPMAWLKPFPHYHFLPAALRSIFVIGLAQVAWELISIASCPPERRAPVRLSPAPGSLPRP